MTERAPLLFEAVGARTKVESDVVAQKVVMLTAKSSTRGGWKCVEKAISVRDRVLKSIHRAYWLLKTMEYEHRLNIHATHGKHNNVANSAWRMLPVTIFEVNNKKHSCSSGRCHFHFSFLYVVEWSGVTAERVVFLQRGHNCV